MTLVEFRWRSRERLISVEDYRKEAVRRLPRMVSAFVEGGADDLAAVHGNLAAFNRLALWPAVLAGHSRVDLATTVLGVDLELPVLLAPTGLTGLTRWDGDVAAARAAEAAGTRYVLSCISSWSIEEVARVTDADHFFQLYPRNGELADTLMKRANDAGMDVLIVTLDCPVMGNRESERRAGMGRPPVLTPRGILNVAHHPRWAYPLLRHQRISGRNLVGIGGMRAALESIDTQGREFTQASLSWDDAQWIRARWPGRLVAKGILRADDARKAADLGFDGVIVSNHGGRQLDHAVAPLDVLPDIADAVGDAVDVLMDGGVRRGTDIVKALALGARAVLIGRPYLYGLAVSGEAGVAGVLDILRDELARALTLLGRSSVRDLDRTMLVPRAG